MSDLKNLITGVFLVGEFVCMPLKINFAKKVKVKKANKNSPIIQKKASKSPCPGLIPSLNTLIRTLTSMIGI